MSFTPACLDVRYAPQLRPFSDYPEQLVEHLTQRYLGVGKGKTLVDLGCGRGEFLDAFSKQGFSVLGLDREKSDATCSPVVVCDIEKHRLPLEDDSVDVLFNKSVLEHVRDITPLLMECRRVLAPGGIFLSMVPDWKAQWNHFFDDWTHVRPFTLTGLSECLASHGLLVSEAKRFRQLPLLWERPYLRPLADAATLLPNVCKRNKWVRFSKEWMLLCVAREPSAEKRK